MGSDILIFFNSTFVTYTTDCGGKTPSDIEQMSDIKLVNVKHSILRLANIMIVSHDYKVSSLARVYFVISSSSSTGAVMVSTASSLSPEIIYLGVKLMVST